MIKPWFLTEGKFTSTPPPQAWGERGVTIYTDGWSDPQRRPLINFVAISEKAPVFFKAANCEGDKKTAKYIFEKLKAVIEEIGPHNVVQVITDNAKNL
jgi:hypothetical protein